jgi:hypothetical protein
MADHRCNIFSRHLNKVALVYTLMQPMLPNDEPFLTRGPSETRGDFFLPGAAMHGFDPCYQTSPCMCKRSNTLLFTDSSAEYMTKQFGTSMRWRACPLRWIGQRFSHLNLVGRIIWELGLFHTNQLRTRAYPNLHHCGLSTLSCEQLFLFCWSSSKVV